ncbi:MAG: DUF2950 domain-containing protein [Limisphaerales bacterium]
MKVEFKSWATPVREDRDRREPRAPSQQGDATLVACMFLALALAVALLPRLASAQQQRFDTPEAAADALQSAARDRDTNAFHALFGPASHDLVSADVVEASAEFQLFLQRLTEKVALDRESDSEVLLQLGDEAWPFPIPLMKEDGQWYFDTAAGKQEVLNRRIGRNELAAIQVCQTYVAAQREYASQDRNNDQVLEYAQHLRSTRGAHDGLYWPMRAGDELSPLGPMVAQARGEGYRHQTRILTDQPSPYHGYFYRVMTCQGRHATGGKYNYIINGHMIAGFALVAWPAQWGNTGVMTFVVNQQGKVFQKNLGPKTATLAEKMTAYDPDSSWSAAGGN